jgi:RNA-splicing ligase RtcB
MKLEKLARWVKKMSDLKIFTENVDYKALQQIFTLVKQDSFANSKIRIMPDVHAGAGCVIGFTATYIDKIIPNIVGVDIGCGMRVANLGKANIDLQEFDEVIKKFIPSGRNVNQTEQVDFSRLKDLRCYHHLKNPSGYFEKSIGTLGSGNHFIELEVDDEQNVYLVIHTGSRNLGKQVAEYYQNVAIDVISGTRHFDQQSKVIIEKYKAIGKEKEIEQVLKEIKSNWKVQSVKIPKDLCYVENSDMDDYLHDMRICQEYAVLNRETIMKNILTHIGIKPIETFETIHNYVDMDHKIIRKGAVSAKKDEILLIPINMRDGSLLCKGKGSEDWNCSAPHGAGRILSRSEAKEVISLDEFEKSMDGIYTTTVSKSTIDESPMAYKPMEEIMNCIKDTVEIMKILKPIYNYKAAE